MLFSAEQMGKNVRLVCKNEECAVFQLTDASGEGVMTFYEVFPGVYLLYNDFHLKRCTSGFVPPTELFCIDHCREGRIEWKLDHDHYVYLEAGDMQLNCRTDHTGEFGFPLGHYHGLTIGFAPETAQDSLLQVMDGFSVDLHALQERFCGGGRNYILRAGKQIEHIFSELYTLPDNVRLPYFKIKVLELLLFLQSMEPPQNSAERPYFYRSQVDKIKDMEALLTSDLEKWYTLEELSRRYDFPLTSMKRCFKGIYGDSVYAYMKAYRMNAAALLLKKTDEPVAQIAGRVGYANPSKFSAAFQAVIGMTPSEYRKARV